MRDRLKCSKIGSIKKTISEPKRAHERGEINEMTNLECFGHKELISSVSHEAELESASSQYDHCVSLSSFNLASLEYCGRRQHDDRDQVNSC